MAYRKRHVLLVMHPWAGYLAGVQWGVSDYLAQQPDWACTRISPNPVQLARMPQLKPDGVIAFVQLDYVARLQRLGVPVVDVADWAPEQHFPRVVPDDVAIGRMAAEHLLDLGLKHFGILGPPSYFQGVRQRAFEERLAKEGFGVSVPQRRGRRPLPAGVVVPLGGSVWLARWLLQMPKPTGIFTTDEQAIEVLDMCHHLGLTVPEQICVLGVDNDELVARFTHPPLSSIDLAARRIGLEAARLLQKLMDGEPPPGPSPEQSVLVVPPEGVVARQSTNLLLIPDPDVREALQYIRGNVHLGVTVPGILRVVPVNRRYLERKFKTLLGRSPLQEIRRSRVERAKSLLAGSDLSLPTIARRSGFANARRLAETFHEVAGTTASGYRRKCRMLEAGAS